MMLYDYLLHRPDVMWLAGLLFGSLLYMSERTAK